jgi:serine/threonine protein kinase
MQHTSVWHWYTNSKTGAKLPLEIHLMQKFSALNYPGIIQYIEHFEICGKYIIIMEFMGDDWVDLYDYIEIFGPVREDHAKEIFTKVVKTVTYLHDMGFCHNDIKGNKDLP